MLLALPRRSWRAARMDQVRTGAALWLLNEPAGGLAGPGGVAAVMPVLVVADDGAASRGLARRLAAPAGRDRFDLKLVGTWQACLRYLAPAG
jgi:hypothetical protein